MVRFLFLFATGIGGGSYEPNEPPPPYGPESGIQPLSSASVTIVQLIAVYLHVYNCLVIIIEYKSALHAMTLMGGAAASETVIGGIFGQ